MIKRIATLFIITGAGYGFSVLAFKYLAQHGEVLQLATIAEVESLIQLMIGLIGFGMQTEAIRNISFQGNWKEKLAEAQGARITFSMFFVVAALLFFSKGNYIYLAMAPFLAFSADYALYARGYPVVGSIVALARVALPLVASVIASIFRPDFLLGTYVVTTLLVYALTNAFISRFLKIKYFYRPALSSLRLYLKTVPLGIINLCFYFFGLGIILFAQFFFDAEELVLTFLALKFYLIFKGAIRVIQQAFVNRMKEEEVCLSVDKISIMMSLLFFGSTIIFSGTFISLFFGKQFADQPLLFISLGISAIVFSLFCSGNTRALLEHKDIPFMKIALTSVSISLITLFVTIQFSKKVELIGFSLLIGECVFAVMLGISFFSKEQVLNRLLFLMACATGLVVPYLSKSIWSENIFSYVISFSVMGVLLLLFSHRKLVLPETPRD